jgi:hypothetical protein
MDDYSKRRKTFPLLIVDFLITVAMGVCGYLVDSVAHQMVFRPVPIFVKTTIPVSLPIL